MAVVAPDGATAPFKRLGMRLDSAVQPCAVGRALQGIHCRLFDEYRQVWRIDDSEISMLWSVSNRAANEAAVIAGELFFSGKLLPNHAIRLERHSVIVART